MTDYRRWEISATLDEARAAETAGWGWLTLAAALVTAAGWHDAAGMRHTALVLAVWACGPLWAAVTRWREAADDRALAAWMGSLS